MSIPTKTSSDIRNEIVFIDQSVPDSGTLLGGLPEGAKVVFIRSEEDGVLQMAEYLDGRSDIDALHIISHGAEGTVYLGNTSLNNDTIDQYQAALQSIGSALSENGDILLYGCEVAANQAGLNFINKLSQLSGADIAASEDFVGNRNNVHSWDLGIQVGTIEATLCISDQAQTSYTGHLSTTIEFSYYTNNAKKDDWVDGSDGITDVPSLTLTLDYGDGSEGSNQFTNLQLIGLGGQVVAPTTQSGPDFNNDSNGFQVTGDSDFSFEAFRVASRADSNGDTFTIRGFNSSGTEIVSTSLNWAASDASSFVTYTMGSGDWSNDAAWGAVRKIVVDYTTDDPDFQEFAIASITVAPAVISNNAPAFASLDGSATFTEAGSAVVIDDNATISDTELDALNGANGDYSGATLTISRNGGASPNDVFGFSSGSVSLSGSNLQSGGQTFATFSQSSGTLTISFTSSGTTATSTLVDSVLQGITYSNSSNQPNASVTLDWVFNDGTDNSSGTNQTTVSVTDVTAAASTAAAFNTTDGTNLTPGITFGAGDETLTIGTAGHEVGSTIEGGAGTDILSITATGVDLSQATSATGFETLSLDSGVNATMTEAQHDAFTTINGTGTNQITITNTTDGLTGDADIETYVLSSANSFTLGTGSQNITGSSGNDTIDGGALTLSGTLDGQGGDDELSLSNGANLSSATVSNIETLTLASGASVTMTEAQHDTFATINAAGTEQITISSATDGLTGHANVETYVLGAANSFTLGADGQNITGSTGNDTIDGGARTLTGNLSAGSGTDELTLSDGASLAGATVSGIETLTLTSGASVSMTEAQHDAFTSINGSGTEQITITAATNGFQTNTNIETYVLGVANAVTVAGGAQNITGSTGNDTVTAQGATLTGTINVGDGTDVLQLTTGSNISGAIVSGFESLTLAGNASVTMTEAQFEAFSTITAGGSETITLASMDGDATVTAHTNIESYVLGAAATLTLNNDQSVTGSAGDDTVDAGTQTLTGTLNGGTGTNNTLMLSNGADISAATVSNFQNLTIASGATVTMTTAQLNGFTGTITASGTETIVLTGTGTLTGTNLGAIEVIQTASGGAETITLTAAVADGKTLTASDTGTDGFIITASSGAQTLNGSAGDDTISGGAGADTIKGGAGTDSLTGGDDNDVFQGSSSDLNGDSITDLSVGDQIRLTGITGLTTSNVRFNGNNLEIDTDATTFASPEISINLGSDLSSTLDFDSVADSGSDTLITLGAANEVPVFTGLDGAPTFTENGSAVVIDSNVTIADTELDALNTNAGNYDGASLTIARNGGADANDVFGLNGGTLTESGTLTISSTDIGTVTANSAGTLTLSFNSSATSALVDQALQSITYSNSSEAPAASVTLDWTFNDGTSNSSGTNQTTVTISALNDAPVLDNTQSPTLTAIDEDVANASNTGTTVADLVVDNSITDADGGAVEAIAVTNVDNTNGIWQYSTDGGTNWNDFSATTGQAVDISTQAMLLDSANKVRFVPDANYNGSVNITFRAWDKTSTETAGSTLDASTNGSTSSLSAVTDTAAITVNAVNDAPTAADATKSVSYNGTYTFQESDFGFSDVDTGDTLDSIEIATLPTVGSFQLNDVDVTANQVISAANIGNLTFTPESGGTGNDYASFTFTVNDNTTDSVSANTITINVGSRPSSSTPTQTSVVDGTTVSTQTQRNSQGNTVEVVTVAPVTPDRQDTDSTSVNADLPFQFEPGNPANVVTTLSLPTGSGVQVLSSNTASSQNQASNLNGLLQDVGGDSEDSQLAQSLGTAFFSTVPTTNTVFVNSIKVTNPSTVSNAPIVITGSSNASNTEAFVIDLRTVTGTRLQLDNIEFASVIGSATVTGGAGDNYVSGDSQSHFIKLGADDDELHGGGGNDTIGSEGGDDLLYGDSGDDIVFGGTGHDTLYGGTGNDVLQGGQTTQGALAFSLNSAGEIVTSFTASDTWGDEVQPLTFSGDWYSQASMILDGKALGMDLSEDNIAVVMNAGLMLQATAEYAFLAMDADRLQMIASSYQSIFGELSSASDLTGLAGSSFSVAELANITAQAWVAQQDTVFSSLSAEQQVSTLLSSFWLTNDVTDAAISEVLTNLTNGQSLGELFLNLAQSQQAKAKLADEQGLLQLALTDTLGETGLSTEIGNDYLYGGAGDDTLIGGHGNDLLDGGEGTDTAVQQHLYAEYAIAQLDDGSITLTYQQGAYTEVDTLVDIEFVQFGGQIVGINELIG
ncbi:RTX-I toxin determinant A from serotypes 1/9 [Marinomonas aquimarina]|uniref:RTX-I toxin determinant A from serotypes 1/9 n=1 Tax=Marinomonas aquimarina TaxID=295068 RepID=A0A1A8T1I6_9GAMM|nr:DUF4347 domain-containing protein [Marinomonas aquimarina]SBS25810.1 RTX-I toxin determinant A from serotypes 1/9 [Marinomonas aquimarina]